MKYHNIDKCSMLNGDGLRVVLFVSGCSHNCEGCQNMITHDPNSGLEFDNSALDEICEYLSEDYISGLTLSGGDPLYQANRSEILNLLKIIKERYPSKTIWCYTGYLYEEVSHLEVLNYIDVLCDGPFIKKLFSPSKHWVGSSNQRVIDVVLSKRKNKIIEKDEIYEKSSKI